MFKYIQSFNLKRSVLISSVIVIILYLEHVKYKQYKIYTVNIISKKVLAIQIV
jgi:hypothetical protein